jgi:ribosomal protein S18 acetylase RimI-like enzyme
MAADIRPARASDVDALLAIENAAFRTDRLSKRAFRHLISSPSAVVLVIVASDCPVAYCVTLFRAGSSVARLYSIATASESKGKGLGSKLIEAAEREVLRRGRNSLRLEVREDNQRAIDIYRRADFEPIGLRPGYYEDGMAAIRFEKRLSCVDIATVGRKGEEALVADGSFSRSTAKTPGGAAS